LQIYDANHELSSPVPGAPGGAIKVTCSKNKGAVLLLHQPAVHEHLEPCRELEEYVLLNFQSWYKYASDTYRLALEMGELMFVTETYKTSRWDNFTFTRRTHEVQLSLQTAVPLVPSASLSVSHSSTEVSGVHKLYGPGIDHSLPLATSMTESSGSPPLTNSPEPSSQSYAHDRLPTGSDPSYIDHRPRNQCLFLQGYVPYKPTLFPPYLKAAAEPEDLGGPPPDENDMAAGTDDDDSPDSEEPQLRLLVESPRAYDPLLEVLQYICVSSHIYLFIAWCRVDLELAEIEFHRGLRDCSPSDSTGFTIS
jgi:hypothetical protein